MISYMKIYRMQFNEVLPKVSFINGETVILTPHTWTRTIDKVFNSLLRLI